MATVIGLTASIGAGKTTISKLFEKYGALIIDCDKIVADFYNGAEGAKLLSPTFPTAIVEGKVRKDLLRAHLQKLPEDKEKLEAIVHPYVRSEVKKFILGHPKDLIVIEIQLLFETGAHKHPDYMIDKTLVVDAPYEQRLARTLGRDSHMTNELFNFLDSRQMPQESKKRIADYIINNGDGSDAEKQVVDLISKIKSLAQGATP